MEHAARRGLFRRSGETALADERQALMASLNDTQVRINQAYSGFNAVADPDLIESYVYEINALQKRYAYLLRRFKDLSGGEVGAPSGALPG